MKQIASCIAIILALLTSSASAQVMYRLSAQARFEAARATGTLILIDTAHYTYSGMRSSRFDYNGLRYTDLPEISTAPVADYINMEVPTNNIDSSALPLVDFDTAAFFVHIGAPAPGPVKSYEGRTYNSAGAIEQVRNRAFDAVSNNLITAQRSTNIYSGGRLSRVYISTFAAGTYDTTYIRYFAYDASGRMILDSLSARIAPNMFAGYRRTTYTYGAGSGYQTAVFSVNRGGSLVPIARTTNAYYPDGRVRSRLYEGNLSGGTFRRNGLDSFGYTPGVQGHTYYLEQIFDTVGKPEFNFFTIAARINAAGQKDSVVYTFYQRGVLQDAGSTAIVYNAAGLPERRMDYELGTGTPATPTLYSLERYYYEAYGAGTAVPAVTAAAISVFPNPTTGIIRLAWPDAPVGTPVSVRITNTAGQLVHSESLTLQGGTQQILLGPEAAPGTYYLSVFDGRGALVYSKPLQKL